MEDFKNPNLMAVRKVILLALFLLVNLTFAQNRVEKPLQIQANFSGLFIDVMANSLADNTVDDLNVNTWLPGLSVGYHFNRFLYLGYSIYSPLDLTLKESWRLNPSVLDADIVLEHQTGLVQNLELRLSPFRFGLYTSLGLAHVNEIDYQMDFQRKDQEVLIGNNAYETDLDISWNSERLTSMTLGLGYNHVFRNGISFNLGLSFPITFPDDENIQISSSETILPSDIEFARSQIQEETFYGPVILYLNVGYNFNRLW